MPASRSSGVAVTPSQLAVLAELQHDASPLLLFIDRRLPRPAIAELKAAHESHRQQVVSSILESVAAMGVAGGAGLLLLHPFTLVASAVLGAGALTATTLVRLLWGTEDANEVLLRALSASVYSPTRELADDSLLSFLLIVAGRLSELPRDLRATVQKVEYDENLDVSVLDQGRLHAVVNDVTAFLQHAGTLPAASSPSARPDAPAQPKAADGKEGQAEGGAAEGGGAVQVEALVVHRLVSRIVGDALANAHESGRHRGSVCELLVCLTGCAIGLLSLAYDYRWNTKRSCLWRKVDLHMVRSLLWVDQASTLQRIVGSLKWQLPAPPPMPVEAEKDGAGEGQAAAQSEESAVAAAAEELASARLSEKGAVQQAEPTDELHLQMVLESTNGLP